MTRGNKVVEFYARCGHAQKAVGILGPGESHVMAVSMGVFNVMGNGLVDINTGLCSSMGCMIDFDFYAGAIILSVAI